MKMKMKMKIILIICLLATQKAICCEKIPNRPEEFMLMTMERGHGFTIETKIVVSDDELIIEQVINNGGRLLPDKPEINKTVRIIRKDAFNQLRNILNHIDFLSLPNTIEGDMDSLWYGSNEITLKYTFEGKKVKKSIGFGQYLSFDCSNDKYMRILYLKEFLQNITSLRNNEGLFIKWQEDK